MRKKLAENFKKYRFEFRHLTVLFALLILFQIILAIIQKSSLQNFLNGTQEWYQKDSAEKIAHLTTTPIELLLQNIDLKELNDEIEIQKVIQSFNIIFSQQILQQNVEDVCLILTKTGNPVVINDGKILYEYLTGKKIPFELNIKYEDVVTQYEIIEEELLAEEKIVTVLEEENIYHLFVPFVPNGEFLGVLYMRKTPNFSNITEEVISSYNEVAIIYSSLIVFGLLAMYYISSYTVKERNKAQKDLFDEHEKHLKEEIKHQKESLFTKRIYHTHHKAEKVMGFIKEDLRELSEENIEEIKNRVNKYSNFISRVIYDMKWYDPPVQTIRNQMFQTNLNDVLRFLVENIFLRISSATDIFEFEFDLDDKMPIININEFVVWEILEPLLQNSIDHSGKEKVNIKIFSRYNKEDNSSVIIIQDNGAGIEESLLAEEDGIKKIFSENISTKDTTNTNSGYGCYIAYEMAVKRCGWILDVENPSEGGSRFIITINH